MSDDIIKGTGTKITKDEYAPCKEHKGEHMVRTIEGSKGSTSVKVVHDKTSGKVDAGVSKPVTNSRGETVAHRTEAHRGSTESAAEFLRNRLNDE